MADDATDPFENIGAGPEGYGGGSASEEPQANAIPEEPEPVYGESLGQDIGNVASQLGKNISQGPAAQIGGALSSAAQQAQPGEGELGSQIGQSIPKIVNYLSGGGALSKDQWEQMNQQVDPDNSMDQNERTLRVIDNAQQQDPQLGAAAIQTARKHYDLYRAGAAKSLGENDMANAVAQANHAFDYVPDGTKTQFTADRNGVISTSVHTMDGQTQKFNLSTDQFHQLLRGQAGMFDHVVTNGAHAVTSAITGAGGQEQQPPHAEDAIGGGAPTKPVTSGDLGPAPGGKQITGNDGKTYTVPEGGKTVTDDEGRIHILGPGQEYSAMTGGATQNPKGQVVDHTGQNEGSEEPITVFRGGVPSLWGNTRSTAGNSPEDIQAAKERFPNQAGAQAAWLAGQRQQQAERENKLNVAKNTRLYGSQAVARGRVEQEGVRQQGNEAVAGIKAGVQQYVADSRKAFEQYKVDHPKDATTSLYQTQINAMEKQAGLHPEWTQDQMDEWLTQKFGRKNWSNVRPPVNVQGPTPQTPAAPSGGGATNARPQPAASQTAPQANAGTPANNADEIRTDGKGNFFKQGPDGRPVLVAPPGQ